MSPEKVRAGEEAGLLPGWVAAGRQAVTGTLRHLDSEAPAEPRNPRRGCGVRNVRRGALVE